MPLSQIQTWAADKGWCQYPLPRSRRRRPRPDKIGLRLVVGALGLFGVIVLGTVLLVAIAGTVIFVRGMISG